MPPGPLYNWLCVLHSTSEILVHAAQIRSAQIACVQKYVPLRESFDDAKYTAAMDAKSRSLENDNLQPRSPPPSDIERASCNATYGFLRGAPSAAPQLELEDMVVQQMVAFPHATRSSPELSGTSTTTQPHAMNTRNMVQIDLPMPPPPPVQLMDKPIPTESPIVIGPDGQSRMPFLPLQVSFHVQSDSSNQSAPDALLIYKHDNPQLSPTTGLGLDELPLEPSPHRALQASRVPSSRLGRLFHYGGLAASLGYGAAAEVLRRTSNPSDSASSANSLIMTPANVSRLVAKLSKMRGAALKLGQFLSIQDTHVLPKDVEEVFRRVQDGAHYMPNWQMERVMSTALGSSWRSNFESFESVPFAAASLGQVHGATLASGTSPTGKAEPVAVKVQFPDISKSVRSDLGYLRLLLTASSVLPKGLFLDNTLNTMEEELTDECNYRREAHFIRLFRAQERIGGDARFRVPWVWDGSTETVLVMERMPGVNVGGNVVDRLTQEDRDEIASRILELCMKELFQFRAMQTDPNWSNFLWNDRTRQIELIDFGATREYSKSFMDNWMHLLQAAVAQDRDACIVWSLKLGYLTGEENETMLDAHVRSLTLLATPFRMDVSRYAFGRKEQWGQITAEIRSLIPVMLRHRLTPPPRETYSLNRKLSGAFLLASRLSASVNCKGIWEDAARGYTFGA